MPSIFAKEQNVTIIEYGNQSGLEGINKACCSAIAKLRNILKK